MPPLPPSAAIPPRNVAEALQQGGFPELWTADQLEWLAAKHHDLGTRRKNPGSHELWHLRWAYQTADILKSSQQPSRR